MSRTVNAYRGPHRVATVQVPGLPLPFDLPPDVHVEDTDDALVVRWPSDIDYVGRLVVPYLTTGGHVAAEYIDIPTSGQFTRSDINQMWLATVRRELATDVTDVAEAASPAASGGRPDRSTAAAHVAWRALERLHRLAIALLARWPTQLARTETWVPVGIHRGVEDLTRTEHLVEHPSAVARRVGDRVAVVQSVRRETTDHPVTSRRLQRAATEVIDATDRLESRFADVLTDDQTFEHLIAPIAAIARRAAPARGVATETAVSSLPRDFRAFINLAVRVTRRLDAIDGVGYLPMISTDALYEHWLVDAIELDASRRWGAPTQALAPPHVGTWATPDGQLALYARPVLRAPVANTHFTHAPVTLQAVLGETLEPDILIALTPHNGEPRFAVWDAKAWRTMSPKDVNTQSSKYLWPIRAAAARVTPGTIDHVALITCANVAALQQPHTRSDGRAWVHRAMPGAHDPNNVSPTDAIAIALHDTLIELTRTRGFGVHGGT